MFRHTPVVTGIFLMLLGSLDAQFQSISMKEGKLTIHVQSTVFLDSGISKEQAKILAIQNAKQSALDEAANYLQTHADVLIKPLDRDEIINSTGSLFRLRISNENTAIVENVFACTVNVEAILDVKDLNTRIKELGNSRELQDQLKAERDRDKTLSDQISKFTKPGCKATEIQVNTLIASLLATEWYYQGYYSTDPDLKIEYFTKSIKLDPAFALAYLYRGYTNYVKSNLENAITDYSKAIEFDPDRNAGYKNRGIVYAKSGRYEDAIRDYNHVIASDSMDGVVYFNRATACYALTRYGDAIKDYTRALELDPSDASIYKNRGSAFYALSNYQAAINDYNEAIKLEPADAGVYYNRGSVYFALNQYEYAKNNFSKTIELDPDFANAYWGRGNAHRRLNEYENAASDYNTYLKINGDAFGNAEDFRKWIREMGYTPEY